MGKIIDGVASEYESIDSYQSNIKSLKNEDYVNASQEMIIKQLESNWNELKKWLEGRLKEHQEELCDDIKDETLRLMISATTDQLSNILKIMQHMESKNERRIF